MISTGAPYTTLQWPAILPASAPLSQVDGACRAAPSAMHSAGLGATTGKTVGAISAVGLGSGTATGEKERAPPPVRRN